MVAKFFAPVLAFQEGWPFLVGARGLNYRALGVEAKDVLVWFRIGRPEEYGQLIG
jgi:hypothetical protein